MNLNKIYKIIFGTLLLFISSQSYGQQDNLWILTTQNSLFFKEGNVEVKSDYRFGPSDRAKSSICDSSGNLKLYTNGDSLYNSKNELIENGSNIGGHGMGNVKILEMPNSPNKYLIVCADVPMAGTTVKSRGLTYSIVEYSAKNPAGIVSKKLVPILPGKDIEFSIIKMTNDSGYWLAARTLNSSFDSVFIFKIDRVGIKWHLNQKVRILDSDCKRAFLKCGSYTYSNRIKFSPLGNYLVVNSQYRGNNIFGFDVKKGELISSHQIFDYSVYSNFEFSPNEKYFYCRNDYSGFTQYNFADLLVNDSIHKVTGRKILKGSFLGDIQLGINGKIYLTKTRDYFIGCIAYPNEKCESIEFTDTAIELLVAYDYLSSNTYYNRLLQSRPDLYSYIWHVLSNNPSTGAGIAAVYHIQRLPQIVPNTLPSYIEQLPICQKDSIFFYARHQHCQDSIHWYVNSTLVKHNESNFLKCKSSKSGKYKVTAVVFENGTIDSISGNFNSPYFVNLSGTTSALVGKPPLTVNFQGQNGITGNTEYKWIFGDTKQSPKDTAWGGLASYTYNDTGRFYPRMIGEVGGCRDTIALGMVNARLLSTNKMGEKLTVKLYPNPSLAGNEVILMIANNKQIRNVTVYNAVGSRVSSHRIEKGENQIALKASTSGIYLIEIEGAGNQIKWVVE
jgi:Secretion system C-terminal sorting domain